MLVTKITDHTVEAEARFLQEYQGRALTQGLMAALVDQIQDLENGIFPIDAGRQLANAVGEQLDGLGTIIGIARNGLSDAEYLLFMFGTIASNNSDTTIPSIVNIINYLFQSQLLIMQEVYPAGISVQVLGTKLAPDLYQTAIKLVQNALGAGINLIFIGGSPTVNVFRFAGSGVVGTLNGFSSLTNPSVGGGFVGIL